jgi:hypothetical protein
VKSDGGDDSRAWAGLRRKVEEGLTGGLHLSVSAHGGAVPLRERRELGRGLFFGSSRIRPRGLFIIFFVLSFPFSIFLFVSKPFQNIFKTL